MALGKVFFILIMPLIQLATIIQAPLERVFHLSRSIVLHQQSMQQKNEKAIRGKTHGFIEKDETVTWQARHLFRTRIMTVKIISMAPPYFFEDIMIEGDFKTMSHKHFFKAFAEGTVMTDEFYFESPYGMFGKLINIFFLTRYMRSLLVKRNMVIKEFAESDKWKTILLQS